MRQEWKKRRVFVLKERFPGWQGSDPLSIHTTHLNLSTTDIWVQRFSAVEYLTAHLASTHRIPVVPSPHDNQKISSNIALESKTDSGWGTLAYTKRVVSKKINQQTYNKSEDTELPDIISSPFTEYLRLLELSK